MSNKNGNGVVNAINQTMIKPFVVGGLCILADQLLLNERYLEKSLYYGAAATSGVFIASSSGLVLERYIPKQTYFDSSTMKTIEGRIAECGFGSLAYYGVSTFVLNSPFDKNDLMKKVAILIVADIISESMTRIIDDII